MTQLELPHINVLTKCDLVDEKELSKYGRARGVCCYGFFGANTLRTLVLR